MNWENPALYEAAKRTMHSLGLPYRDPRTGVVTQPPKKAKKQAKKKNKKRRKRNP